MNLDQAQTDALIISQIGKDTGATTNPNLPQAQANAAATAAQGAIQLNAAETSIYLTAFQNWSALVMAGKIDNSNPPQPPTAYFAAKATDGWTYIVKGTDPVCAMPPIPVIPTAPAGMVVAIGSHLAKNDAGDFWAALPANANVSNGYTTPTPVTTHDGVSGLFTWEAWPFGGWWEKVG